METYTKLIKTGFLKKAPPFTTMLSGSKKWKKRFFTLQLERYREHYDEIFSYNVILYYSKEDSIKGYISLKSCDAIRRSETAVAGYNYVIELRTRDRTYHIATTSITERNEWMSVLMSSFQSIQDRAKGGEHPSDDRTIDSLRRDSLKRCSITDSGFDERSGSLSQTLPLMLRIKDRCLPPIPQRTSGASLQSSIGSDSSTDDKDEIFSSTTFYDEPESGPGFITTEEKTQQKDIELGTYVSMGPIRESMSSLVEYDEGKQRRRRSSAPEKPHRQRRYSLMHVGEVPDTKTIGEQRNDNRSERALSYNDCTEFTRI